MATALDDRTLGRTGLTVSNICVGTSPLGSSPGIYGYEVDEVQALATLREFFSGPFTFLDTSNNYGQGRSEQYIGTVLKELGGVPRGFTIATKVDAVAETKDFSGDRVRRSAEESSERMGLDHFDVLHLHDPESVIPFKEAMKPGGAVETLLRLKEEGVAGSVGIATGDIETLRQYLETGAFDVMLSHNHYTLVDRTAEPLVERCAEMGVGFLNAAPYGGGMLAKGAVASPRYAYGAPSDLIQWKVGQMSRLCEAENVPLAAAALQFSMRDDRVGSTVIGVSRPERIRQTVELANYPIPNGLMERLDLIGKRAELPS